MRGPRGVTTALRGWYIGWLQDEAGRGGERGSVRRGSENGVVAEEELRETETWPNRN